MLTFRMREKNILAFLFASAKIKSYYQYVI